jgi:hypothetical protein
MLLQKLSQCRGIKKKNFATHEKKKVGVGWGYILTATSGGSRGCEGEVGKRVEYCLRGEWVGGRVEVGGGVNGVVCVLEGVHVGVEEVNGENEGGKDVLGLWGKGRCWEGGGWERRALWRRQNEGRGVGVVFVLGGRWKWRGCGVGEVCVVRVVELW